MSTLASSTVWEWPATGSTWRIFHSGAVTFDLARAAAEAVDRDERRWSRFLPDSEVTRINGAAGHPVPVSRETLELLEACTLWADRTGGVFQPLVGGAMVAWGYRRGFRVQSPFAPASPARRPLDGRMVIDRRRGTVRITAGSRLDLGGIGKSWIAVRIAKLLFQRSDDPQLLVDAGGDLVAVRGDHIVDVEAPDIAGECPSPAAHIHLREGHGVATSGYGRRQWTNGDGRVAHHLLDPATGTPGPLSHATVVSADPVAADVLAKVLALRPERIHTFPEPAIVTVDGGQQVSRRWQEVVAE